MTIKDLANAFLNAKQALVDRGELLSRTWIDYKVAADPAEHVRNWLFHGRP